MSDASGRFVALDVHKSYLVVGAVDAAQTVVLSPRKVDARRFDEWARQHLRLTDIVVFEVTTNAWALYDLLTPLVAQVVVANPAQVEVIAHALVKTDTRDTLALARLLAAHLIPQVWVPPKARPRVACSHRSSAAIGQSAQRCQESEAPASYIGITISLPRVNSSPGCSGRGGKDWSWLQQSGCARSKICPPSIT